MYPQTLYPKTRQVLDKLKKASVLTDFYLAGGTGLAIQLGHRKSVDLDFFAKDFPKRDLLLAALKKFKPKITQEAPGTIDLIIFGVKVSFLEYNYPLVGKLVDFEKVKVASIADISCMKLSAISSRGSKKDLIDLYFILKRFSLEEVLKAFEEKFKGVEYQKLHLFKSMIYFADAEKDPDPDMVESFNWQEVKDFLEEKVSVYSKKLNEVHQ